MKLTFLCFALANHFTFAAQTADSTTTPDVNADYYRLEPAQAVTAPAPCTIAPTPRAAAAPPLFKKTVTLRSGTTVLLQTRERKFSGQVKVGTKLHFQVVLNVMSDGEIVIRTGAAAIGIIKEVRETTTNGAAEITIALQHVQAVDDTLIPLIGDELTIPGEYAGEDAIILPLQQVTATVANNTPVTTN